MPAVPAIIGAAGAIGGGIIASNASSSAADKQAKAITNAQNISASAGAKARVDALGLFNPALQDFANGILGSIDQVATGQVGTTQILRNTVRNADQVLAQGSTAAQAAILGIDPNQYPPYQQAQQFTPQQATQSINRGVGPVDQNTINMQRDLNGQYQRSPDQTRQNTMLPGSTPISESTGIGERGTFGLQGVYNQAGNTMSNESIGNNIMPAGSALGRASAGINVPQTNYAIPNLPQQDPLFGAALASAANLPADQFAQIQPQVNAAAAAAAAPGLAENGNIDRQAAGQSLFGAAGGTIGTGQSTLATPENIGGIRFPTGVPAPTAPENLLGTGLTGVARARQDIAQGQGAGQQYLANSTGIAAGALGAGAQGALGAYDRALGTYGNALNASQGSENRALQALLGNFGGGGGGGTGLGASAYGLNVGTGGFTGSPGSFTAKGVEYLQNAEGRGLEQIQQGTQQGLGYLDSYNQAGQSALARQAAITGAAGPEAQQQAINDFTESPGQDWLRNRQEQALLRNSAAIGGLGGGTVRTALQDQAAGIAAQQQQQYINNLAQLAGQGQAAAGSQAGLAQQGGLSGGNLVGSLAGQAASLYGNQASIEGQLQGQAMANASNASIASARLNQERNLAAANLIAGFSGQNTGIFGNQAGVYGNQANVYGNLGSGLAGLYSGTGVNQANLAVGAGQDLSGLAERGGTQLANVISGTAAGQAGLQTGLGGQLSAYNTDASNNIANLVNQAGTGQADLRTNLAALLANLTTGQGTQGANLALSAGQAQAAGTLGSANALSGALTNLGSSLGNLALPAYNTQNPATQQAKQFNSTLPSFNNYVFNPYG